MAIRVLALTAIVAVAVAAGLTLLGGEDYRVRARFVSASQLVEGNLVRVAGEEVGTVERIDLTDDSQAEVTLSIDGAYAPLREGTRATVRIPSLSGVANRYVDLQLGPPAAPRIPDGGVLEAIQTEAAVDVGELFNVFDEDTRRDTKRTIRLFAELNAGRADQAQAALRYLSPALASASRLFEELSSDDAMFDRFIVETARLAGDVAQRDDDLAGLVRHAAVTLDALATERDSLGRSIELLPSFMRRANSTFVNLRATLDDLEPLVDAAEPLVARELPQLLDRLRPLARDAEPTVRDLSRTITREGDGNDLIELLRAQPALRKIAVATANRNGEERPGAFPAARDALRGGTPQLAFLRPYTVDMVGWFDDFSASGVYDALGSFSRAGLQLSGFTFTPATGVLPVPPALQNDLLGRGLVAGRNNRCPGSSNEPAEDGSNPWKPSPTFNCDVRQVPGPVPAR